MCSSDLLLPAEQSRAIEELIDPLIVPTLVVNSTRTAALRADARKSQPPVHVSHGRGDVLISEGQPVTAFEIELLEQAGLASPRARVTDVVAAGLIAVLAGAASGGALLVLRPEKLQLLPAGSCACAPISASTTIA